MLTLYDAFVPSCLQMLDALSTVIDGAQQHCQAQSIANNGLINARLAPDMFDFAYQVKSCTVHSIGAIRGVQQGHFSPDMSAPPESFEAMNAQIAETVAALKALSVDDVEGFSEKPMIFTIGDKLRLDFLGKDFLLSFSQPNFYFHATTAYGILRANGVPIGKRDYLGPMRFLRTPPAGN